MPRHNKPTRCSCGDRARATLRLGVLALALVAIVASCKSRQIRVAVNGSSTVYPITEAMAEEFGKVRKDIQVTVGVSGTGGGFKKFCAGESDICDASRPIRASELEQCKSHGIQFLEVPVAYDGIAIVVHPSNDWAKEIKVEELKRLWEPAAQGKVLRWSQVREGWPDKEIHLFGPGVDSGTYDYFTEAIVGQEHSSRGDYTSSEDDNVIVQGVATDPLALGYFGLSYLLENTSRLKAVPVDDGKAENGAGAIAPSRETVRDSSYQPLSRPIFIYVASKSLERPETVAFVDYYLGTGRQLIDKVGYVGLPERTGELVRGRVDRRVTGTMFGGEGARVGVALDALLQAPAAP